MTAGLGASRRADAWDVKDQACLITRSSVSQPYRIGPERDSQAGAWPLNNR
jgi:hypothetical protein